MAKTLAKSLVTNGVSVVISILACSLAKAQSQNDWTQYARLVGEYSQVENTGQWDRAEPAAIKARDFVLQRFPERLHFVAYESIAQLRHLQGKYDESLKLRRLQLELIQGFQPRTRMEQIVANIQGFANSGVAQNLSALGRYEESLPYLEKTIAWWERVNDASSLAQGRADLGTTYLNLGQFDKAAEQYRPATAILEKLAQQERPPGHSTRVLAETLRNWGAADGDIGRFDLAEPKLRRAIQLIVSVHGWKHPHTGDVLNRMGSLLERQGRWNEARAYYQEAVKAYEASGDINHLLALHVRSNAARVLRHQEKNKEAEAEFRRLIALLEASPVRGFEHSQTQTAYVNLAATLIMQGKYDEAEAIGKRLLGLGERKEFLQLLALSKAGRGKADDLTDALALLDRVLEISEQENTSPNELCRVQIQRATLLWSLGRQDEALEAGEESIKWLEVQRRYSSGAEREQAMLFEGSLWHFDAMVDWQVERGDVAELFQTIERKKARSFLDELRLKGVDLLAGLPADERQRLNDRTDQLRRRLGEAEKKYESLPSSDDDASESAQVARRQAVQEILAARNALYRHLTDVRASSPVYRELVTSETDTVSLADVQKQLAHGELMLAYHVGNTQDGIERDCYVVIIRADSAEFQKLNVSEAAAAVLGIKAGPLTGEQLAKALLDDDSGVVPALSDSNSDESDLNGKLAALWTVLMPEGLRAELNDDKVKLLTVLPAGPLALLPFEALVVSNDPETKYFLDAGPQIAYAPSASVLLNLAGRDASDQFQRERVLTLGDPDYSQKTEGPDALDRQLGVSRIDDRFRAGLNRLPFSGLEAEWVKQVFDKAGMPAVKLTGRQATESQLRRLISGREIVHLACHGMASQSYGNLFGSLAVAPGRADDPNDDGFLSMGEIYELDLTGCELAILSACETNYGPQQKGEGVWALSRGFLVAGARRVVASNWVVDDQAGATLISYFASYLSRAGTDASARDYASALHKAKQLVRKDQDSNGWSHPFYWSSLVLVGPK